jgi:hydrogenase large subunit
VAHYLEALEWQKEIVKIHAIFGGKNPHPNYLVGGMACSIGLDDVSAINAERLAYVGQLLHDAKDLHVNQVYIPDLLAVAPYYLDWGAIGGGLGNYLAYGDLPTNGYNAHTSSYKFPAGAILNKDLSKVHEVNMRDDAEIQRVHPPLLVRIPGRRRRFAPLERRNGHQVHGPETAVRATWMWTKNTVT